MKMLCRCFGGVLLKLLCRRVAGVLWRSFMYLFVYLFFFSFIYHFHLIKQKISKNVGEGRALFFSSYSGGIIICICIYLFIYLLID